MGRKTEIKADLFAKHYIEANCNGTEAMRRCGHPGSDTVRADAASAFLRKAEVQERLSALRKALEMTAEEAVQRMSEMGRVDIADYLDEDGCFDLKKAKELDRTRFIKEYKVETEQRTVGAGEAAKPITVTKTTFKLHDAQTAVQTMMKRHGLLKDKTVHEAGESLAETLAKVLGAHQESA